MKKRNGFTLIELLAVIAILAIILLIAVPMILEVINKAKKSAFTSSCKMIISAAEKHYALGLATGDNNLKTYSFTTPVGAEVAASTFVTAKGITAGKVAIAAGGVITIPTAISDGTHSTTDPTCTTITG